MGVDARRPRSKRPRAVAIPMRLRTDDGELAFITMIATFGTALDITLAELALETFLPADTATARSCTPAPGVCEPSFSEAHRRPHTMRGVRLSWPDATLPDEIYQGLVGPGAPFELVTEDVLGVPMQVFANRPRNLRELLLTAAERFGDRRYVVFPERTITYGEMPAAAAAVARTLSQKYGVGKGDRVAIAAANCVEYALTFWATTMLGGITVAMNGWWTGSEMTYALDLTTPTVLLGDRRRIERLDGEPARPEPVVVFEDDVRRARSGGRRRGGARPADRRGRPVPHPVHERHDRPPQGRVAVAPQQHPLHLDDDDARRRRLRRARWPRGRNRRFPPRRRA